MGYVNVPRLIDVNPIRLTTVGGGVNLGWLGDRTARITAATTGSDGFTITAPHFTITGRTEGAAIKVLTVRVWADISKAEVERLNKYLRGTGWPRYETNWRTGTVCMNVPGTRVELPVAASAILKDGKEMDGDTFRYAPFGSTVSEGLSPAEPTTPPSVAEVGEVIAATASSKAPVAPVASPPVTPPSAAKVGPLVPPALPSAEPPLRPYGAKPRTVSPVKPEPVSTPLTAVRMEPTGDPNGVFTYPTKTTGIIIPKGDEDGLDRVWKMHLGGDRQVIALIGPAGTGKTSLAYDLAARHKVPIAKIDGPGFITFADWVGFQSATESNGATVTSYQPSGFIQAVRADGPEAGKPRILLVDEVSRAESSSAINALIPCLDDTGSLYVPDAGRSIPLDPAVMFMFTANMGVGYTGTVSLDVAFTDRVTHWVHMTYPELTVEVELVKSRTGLGHTAAFALVNAATQVRQVAARGEITEGVGPRKVLQAARKIVAGFSPREAAMNTWVLSYKDEGGSASERSIVRTAIEAYLK
jgi:MoxR-like ATPase